jgi:hypothetical protein
MAYMYEAALPKTDVIVYLIDELFLYPDLSKLITEASCHYGFQFRQDKKIALEKSFRYDRSKNTQKIKHIIIVGGIDNPQEITERYYSLISQCTSATICMTYSSRAAFLDASQEVEHLKSKYNGKINYLLPNVTKGMYVPRKQKIVDNSICDSVRIKYKPQKINSLTKENIPDDVKCFFSNISRIIKAYKLHHRASTDGFISIRDINGNPDSFYISCTKTDKVNLDLDRISLVHTYNRGSNSLLYSGSYLPSSDSVEAAVLYQDCKAVNGIVHTHASKNFTRNSSYSDKIAIPPSSYGEPQTGSAISAFLNQSSFCDFIIMEDHGELFMSTQLTSHDILNDIQASICDKLNFEQSK